LIVLKKGYKVRYSWVIVVNAKCAYFHIFYSEKKFHFIEMMYVVNTLTWDFTVVAIWNDSPLGRYISPRRYGQGIQCRPFDIKLRVLVIPLVSSNLYYMLSLMTLSFIPSVCYIILNAPPLFSSATISSIFYYLSVCSRRDHSYITDHVLLSISQCIWIVLRGSSTNIFHLIIFLFNSH
jgi:hypothetical protein